ncbi:hypothetical protein MPTK1_3g03510 [Marchantia polymorpha subsp. ruderalis]|uniref:Uncharacterized protein n=2 Tax=Marchantia polymorpha TaxID=3197 RepID=A0AAF6AX23_MARPO|nr:hypothetical protein MARPO_0022s0181 [Marchantia polymorpha]BBN04307.1 hypothetical protein Mp_3g03510 [Marchantia polymorpha subsp. ruderalis]|eukprot:PTQ44098.1 hypothetical protein MARPO_0022s0181 [Marchantia polymorpha]
MDGEGTAAIGELIDKGPLQEGLTALCRDFVRVRGRLKSKHWVSARRTSRRKLTESSVRNFRASINLVRLSVVLRAFWNFFHPLTVKSLDANLFRCAAFPDTEGFLLVCTCA